MLGVMKRNLTAALLAALIGAGCASTRSDSDPADALLDAMKGLLAQQIKATSLVKSTPEECVIARRAAAHLFSGRRFTGARVRDHYDDGGYSVKGDLDRTMEEISAFLPEMPTPDVRRFAAVMAAPAENIEYGFDCDWTAVDPSWRSNGDLADVEAMFRAPNIDAALAAPRTRWNPCRFTEDHVQICNPYVQVNLYRPVRPAGSDDALVWASVSIHPDGVQYERLCHLKRAGADWRVMRCAKHPRSAA